MSSVGGYQAYGRHSCPSQEGRIRKSFLDVIWELFNMRVNQEISEYILKNLHILDQKSDIYLFGSRMDDWAKGGDIDILWLTEQKVPARQIRSFRTQFYHRFGWQKIDIVNFTFKEENPFKALIIDEAIPL